MADNNFMEQEAIRRANEIQSRVQKTNSNNRSFFQGNPTPPFMMNNKQNEPQGLHTDRHRQENSAAENKAAANESSLREQQKQSDNVHNLRKDNNNLVDLLLKDKDKSIIMLLILILTGEGADTGLILALMYLML